MASAWWAVWSRAVDPMARRLKMCLAPKGKVDLTPDGERRQCFSRGEPRDVSRRDPARGSEKFDKLCR